MELGFEVRSGPGGLGSPFERGKGEEEEVSSAGSVEGGEELVVCGQEARGDGEEAGGRVAV